jgi:hypothetical protein
MSVNRIIFTLITVLAFEAADAYQLSREHARSRRRQ